MEQFSFVTVNFLVSIPLAVQVDRLVFFCSILNLSKYSISTLLRDQIMRLWSLLL